MPRPRFERLDAARRDAILDAAEEEFAAHGFAQASYNRIIERSGVSKGAMYYYFDDKADLYLTVVRRTTAELIAVVGEVGEVSDPEGFWAECGALAGRAIGYFMAEPRRGERIRGLVRSLAEAPPGVREVTSLAEEPTRKILEAGQRVGAVRDDLPIGLLVAMTLGLGEAIDTWMATHWESLPPDAYETYEGELMGVFRRVCAP